ncbi:hypothetical protein H0274_13695 [Altererythrobacter sp. CC-YST694]|uniref:hypothetical protein n=1 Tax=Altererythrobacter sp. CC-YST694 TaxID=2755038 RepID=UPI001D009FB7|nr:hypothetical protein [Altererythrobacter sp. CC-YST694]MCB5426316.1 hypothetical protein [Altererythrobacter sp. CC-YST694]
MSYEALRLSVKRSASQRAARANNSAPAAPARAAQYNSPPAPDTEKAAQAARVSERARIATVFGSPLSLGRERSCVRLLIHDHGWSASSIVSLLAELPTDAEQERHARAAKQARTADVWDRALSPKNEASENSRAGDIWDRAIKLNNNEA